MVIDLLAFRCLYQCKDTNFLANHNYFPRSCIARCCLYQCKDTNFLANHNTKTSVLPSGKVVYTNAKIRIS